MQKIKRFELKMPKFLLAVEPKRMPNGFHFIYSPYYLSLILVIRERTQIVVLNDELLHRPQQLYTISDTEQFRLVILQNNVKITGGELAPEISETQFLDEAWQWYNTNMITQE